MMAAACATSSFDARRERGSSDRKTPPPSKIGLDDCEWGGVEAGYMLGAATRRCDGFCMMELAPRCELLLPTRALARACWPIRLDSARSKDCTRSVKLLDVTQAIPQAYGCPPPSYCDAVADAPPDYTTTDYLARPHTDERRGPPPYPDSRRREQKTASLLEDPMPPRAVDLGDTSGFVTHVGAKKKKQAAKQADKAKWANSDDEGGSKEGGEANENAGGAGGSNNGDGGAGGDDGDDFWDTGKKKKGKKGKGGVDEEKEKKKKDDEEEEKKRKEEEERAKREEEDVANGDNPLSWADSVGDGNPDDDWGGFTSTAKKGKKGKKGKAADPDPSPLPPLPPPAPYAPAGSTNPPSIGTFDDINLDDSVPKLDLDFGGSTTKEAGSSFGFGGWGNSWNTGSKWDFSSADAGTTAPPDDAKASKGDIADNSSWSFGKKKDKKSTFSSGYDFGDLGSVGEMQEEVPMSNGIGKQEEDDFGGFTATGRKDKKKGKKGVFDALPEEDPAVIVVPEAETTNGDSWGGWGTASSKKEKDKKKGKKGVIEEVPVEEPTVVVVPEPETAADDSWGGWDPKKDKKKGKKGEQEPLPPPPPPPPPDPIAAAEGEWGTFGTKNKKKGKKGAVEQVSKVEEPVISVLPELDEDPIGYPEYEPEAAPPAVPDTWGSFGNKKDKKKGKKDAMEGITKVEDSIAVVVPDVVPEPATTAADHAWGSATTKKDKKKGKKGAVDEISKLEEPLVVTVPEMETAGPAADDSWTSFGSKKDNKKKGKKGVFEEIPKVEDPPIVVVPDLAPTVMDDEWGMFGSKKDKKKGKNGAFEEHTELDDPGTVDVPEQESAVDIGWGGWGGASKTDKKSKKKGITEVVDVPLTVNEPAPAFEKGGAAADDDWMNFGTGKKNDEKGRKGAVADSKADEFLPPPPPPPRMVPNPLEDSKSDDWASFGTSKQSKDKKGKKGKVSEATPVTLAPEPLVAAINEPDVTGVEDIWPTEGLSSKDKKKKEKDKAKRLGQDASIEVVDDPTAMPGTLPDAIVDLDAPAEADSWGIWGTGSKKDQKKAGKKSHVFEAPPPAPTPPAQGLTPEPTPPPFSALDDPEDCEWGTFAPVKTKGKKDIKKEPLIRTTSASKGATTEVTKSNKKGAGAKEPVDDFFDGLDDVDEDRSAAEVKKESPKEETPAKAVKGFWGSFGSTATSKTKTAKDKAKEKEEEKGKSEAQEQIKSDPVLEVVDRTDKKGSKIQKNGKLGKVESKGSDKSGKVDSSQSDDIDALIDLMDGDPDLNDDELADLADSFDKKDDKKSDAWSFWGSSKKPTGKKADEPNQEIGKQTSTNQKASLGKPPKEPEPPIDDQPLFPPPPPATATAMNKSISAKSKVAGKLSVSEKIKALEKEKEEKAKPIPPPPPPEPEAPPKADTPPKKSNSLAKAKPVAASKGAATSKQKVLSPDPAKDKASKEAVPGSFPFEGADDDIIDVIDLGPIDKKASKKVKRGAEKAKMDPMIVDVPAPPSPPSPPTPPPEPAAVKPVKKERARVVRGETASSWGFWGAAPKKEVKKEKAVKDDVDGDSPPAKAKASPPGLVRSKSTKTGTGKETEKSSSKSSGSDKATKPEAKPSKSRGMSFSQLLMGSPSPARTMSTRRSSNAVPKTSSRRQSIDVGAVGLMSPPPDDKPEVPAKAAKIMGMGPGKIDRRPSTKGKQKLPGVVPDPYAIDDDDLVMVNGDYDAMVDVPIKASSSKKKGPESKAKKLVGLAPLGRSNPTPLAPTAVIPERPGQTWNYLEPLKANMNSKPKQFGGATTATDDIVMVEAGPSNDGPEVTTGSDDLAFVLPPREPAPLKRSMSSAKRPEKLMGLFGSFRKSRRASETFESPKTKAVYGTDDSKRLRREDRKVGRSGRGGNDAEDFGGDFLPGGGAFTEPEEQGATKHDRGSPRVSRDNPTKKAREADARAADERRARRREAEKAEEERRRAKAREARQKRVREEEEEEARRREEKKARRAAREDRHAGKTLANDETGNRDGEHRKRHRDKGLSSGAPSPMVDERSPRPRKTERRRSHIDKPVPRYDADEEADRRVRREARNTREGLNRRKSAPPVEDYFDPRNGSRGVRPNDVVPDVPVYNAPAPLPTHTDPYLNGANDHTSSWINSQIIEPPAFPPVEPTVIEPPPTGIGRKHEELDDDDQDVRREVRRSHRHSKYASVTPDGGDGHRRRREPRRAERDGIRSSEGSEGDRYTRRKSDYAGYENGGPVRTFDGRLASAGPAKRGSWFKKFANL